MQIRKGGVWRAIQSCKIRKGNAWRSIVQIKIFKGGAWREVANFTQPPSGGGTGGTGGTGGGVITADAAPNPCEGFSTTSTVITEPCTVTPTGGLAPYTYLWSIIAGTATINSVTSATTTFTHTVSIFASAFAQCVVTDSLGTTVTVSGIALRFTHEL